jgi:hypothetical protein
MSSGIWAAFKFGSPRNSAYGAWRPAASKPNLGGGEATLVLTGDVPQRQFDTVPQS